MDERTYHTRTLRKTYFTNALENCGHDSKKLWRIIKKLLGGGNKKTTINELNGSTDNKEMANILDNFFTDIGPELSADIPDSLLNIDHTSIMIENNLN